MYIEIKYADGRIEFAHVVQEDSVDRLVTDDVSAWREISGDEFAQGPPAPFAQALEEARIALKERRKEVEKGGFIYRGRRWDSEEKDELRLNSILTRMISDQSIVVEGWKIADGVYLTLDLPTATGAADAMMAHYSRAFAVEAAKLGELSALSDAAELRKWLEEKLDEGW